MAEEPTITLPGKGRIPLRDIGDPSVCVPCQFVVVNHGAIAEIQMDGPRVASVVLVGGTLHQVDANKREVPLTIRNSYGARRARREGPPIRGLVVDGTVLRGIIRSVGELPFRPARVPSLRVVTKDMAGGTPRVRPGGAITIHGSGFAPGLPVSIRVDGELAPERVRVDGRGRFRVALPVALDAGDHVVAAAQQEGKRLSMERARFRVTLSDEPPSGTRRIQ